MNEPSIQSRRKPAARPASAWSLAWRQTLRDARSGELRLLALAVVLAVAALSAVAFFADRINAGLSRDARQLLGGDALISADQPLPAPFIDQARALGLRTAQSTSFPSMARAPEEEGGQTRLVAVKAVSAGYPLRGRLTLRAGPPGTLERSTASGPDAGQAWVDPGLLDALDLQLGDDLLLGDARLTITQLIINEPDRGAGFMSFSPRVMIHESDLPATGLIQPASRVTYRLLVAAAENTGSQQGDRLVGDYTRWAQEQIDSRSLRGVRVESFEAGRPEMRQTLDRAGKFLHLVALLSALLAAVAVGIGARDFSNRHLDACAMLRVLGLAQHKLAAAFAIEFLLVGMAASVVGVGLGYALHHAFVFLLAGLVNAALPQPSLWPALFGSGVGLVLLVGFGLPPVLQLARVPPLRVIRRDMGDPKASSLLVLGTGAAGFAGLLLGVSSDIKLGLIVVGGFAAALLLFAGLAALAVLLLRRLLPRLAQQGMAARWLLLATQQLAARPVFAIVQVSALSVGLLALVLLVLLRTDLVASWRQATPPDAPNRFVINLQPDQGQAFQGTLREAGVEHFDWYPMIRGRLVAINGRDIKPEDYKAERAQRLVDREFNLSHAAALPEHNQLTAGVWTPEEPEGLSVEEGLAQTLDLKLGDELRFDIAGVMVQARISSLRKVDWGSMRVNFFVLFPRSRMPDLPTTYISAFKAPTEAAALDRRLARDFPNVTNVDISASIAQVQQVLDQVIRAIEFLFAFTLAAGLVVLLSALAATREARAREYAVMRALGAGQRLLARMQGAELLGVGLLAGFLASSAAVAVGWALARYAFEFDWQPHVWVPLAGALGGGLIAWLSGWWTLRDVLRRPVVDTLRRASQ